ncbi:MAG TPA: hypothetical protein VGG03_11555 [Thermoanaerobaculia bacterium]|jgi:hypothetical protein
MGKFRTAALFLLLAGELALARPGVAQAAGNAGDARPERDASAPYLREEAPKAFAAADGIVQDLYVESDIGHVFTVDLGLAAGWPYPDQETEGPPDDGTPVPPGVVQVYQPTGNEVEEADAEEAEVYVETLEEAFFALEPAGENEAAAGEEDLPEEETAAEDVQAVLPPGEAAAQAEADPAAGKEGSAPAAEKDPQKVSEPAGPKPASPPADPHPKPPPIG